MIRLTHDAAGEAWYWPDIAAEIDGDGDSERVRAQIEGEIEKRARKAASIICNHVVCTILGYSNTRLALIAYAIAHGVGGLGEKSIQEQAIKLGVSKAALSKEITWFRDVYRLEAMGALKSNGARIAYRKAQIKHHKKPDGRTNHHFGFSGSYNSK